MVDLLDAVGGIVAHYEYDPFGGLTTQVGSEAMANLWRFSTKPHDTLSGFYYYGFRYYDPFAGRWPSRDPIEEQGGMNVYSFVYNSPLGWIDILGKEPSPKKPSPKTNKQSEWDKWNKNKPKNPKPSGGGGGLIKAGDLCSKALFDEKKKAFSESTPYYTGITRPARGVKSQKSIPTGYIKWDCFLCSCKGIFTKTYFWKETSSGKEQEDR